MISPSVYLAFDTMTAEPMCGSQKVYSDGMLTLHPSDLFSIITIANKDCESSTAQRAPGAGICDSFWGVEYFPKSFNIADLRAPVPAKAYFAGNSQRIFNGELDTVIVENNYFPRVSLPRAITNIDLEYFRTCAPLFENKGNWRWSLDIGVWDPPVVLTVASPEELPLPTPFPGAFIKPITGIPTQSASPPDHQITAAANFDPIQAVDTISGYTAAPTQRNQEAPQLMPIIVGLSTFTVQIFQVQSSVLIDSQTLRIGGPPGIVGGETISLDSGWRLVVGKPAERNPSPPTMLPGNTGFDGTKTDRISHAHTIHLVPSKIPGGTSRGAETTNYPELKLYSTLSSKKSEGVMENLHFPMIWAVLGCWIAYYRL
jgi:hypothetical protein